MEANANSLEAPEDLGTDGKAVAKRWKLELKLAEKRDKEWAKKVKEIYATYTPEKAAVNSFNILWPNTETLRQAVYNSLPQPEVRRRYQDDDPLGKAVSDVLTRSLEFSQDTYDFDAVLKGDVLAMLLPGRAVSRVKYVPDIKSIGGEKAEEQESDANSDEEAQESEAYEEIDWEQVICERIQWDDFRILCAAKTWDEVSAIGFRHRMTRDDCIEKFGEQIGEKIPLDSADDSDVKKSKDIEDLFKTAEVWEIWDKDDKKVYFINQGYAEPCKTQNDPLKLQGFFPVPRPLYAIESDTTLVPTALYSQYEQQARELNKISVRINKLIDGLKLRGVYDATLTELSDLMEGGDNRLIPAVNLTALLERGGLEKAIWMMPINVAAAVLKELYVQRDQTKQIIYEITGIADIMRSASDPNETYGAQKIKTKWGTQRLQKLQMEVQRYIRDLIRLKAEIISEKFQMPTLEAMTLLKFPHQAEIDAKKQQAIAQFQQAQQQWQQAAMQSQQTGQPPPPQPKPPQIPPDPVTWEAVMDAMHDDATRTYRVDIETDSTLAATQEADFDGLNAVFTGVASIWKEFMPMVQSGQVDVSVVKELMLVFARRSKMGNAVEDAINKIQQPQPQGDPEKAKAEAQAAAQQQKDQSAKDLAVFKAQVEDNQHQRELAADAQAAERQAQLDAKLQENEQNVQAMQNQHQNMLESQRAQDQAKLDAMLEQQRQQSEERLQSMQNQVDMLLGQLERQTRLEVAEIASQTTLDAAQVNAAKSGAE